MTKNMPSTNADTKFAVTPPRGTTAARTRNRASKPTSPRDLARDEFQRRRKAFGDLHKTLRKDAGKTQLQMSQELGLDYYTMISQVEAGTARIPPARLRPWAKSLGLTTSALALRILHSTEPELSDAIFGEVISTWADYQNDETA